MRHSRIQKHFNRHMYSRCMVRSGEAGMRRAPLIGIRFADGLSAGGYEGVRSADEQSEELSRSESYKSPRDKSGARRKAFRSQP